MYSAETQLVRALAKMADAAAAHDLKRAFESHLEETRGHVVYLNRIFTRHGESPTGERSEAMEGLIDECDEFVRATADDEIRDAGLIAAAQRVEHYEISAYGSARALAERLGFSEDAVDLQTVLDQERAADTLLSTIAEGHVNADAQGV
jgi:ferritin-like metal-binding protein YciE